IGIFLSKDFTMKNPLERMVPPIRPSRLRIERILKWRSKNQKGTSKNFRQPGRRNALDIHTLFLEKQRQGNGVLECTNIFTITSDSLEHDRFSTGIHILYPVISFKNRFIWRTVPNWPIEQGNIFQVFR